MAYELWDGELGLRLGHYDTQGEALAAVRRLTDGSRAIAAPLGLTVDRETVIASGEALVRLAQSAQPTDTGE